MDIKKINWSGNLLQTLPLALGTDGWLLFLQEELLFYFCPVLAMSAGICPWLQICSSESGVKKKEA